MGRIFLALAAVLAAAVTLEAQADERVIYTSVVDRDGAPVLDLGIKDFIVREDGQAREILQRRARQRSAADRAARRQQRRRCGHDSRCCARRSRRSSTRPVTTSNWRSSRSRSGRRFSSATRPIARPCVKRHDNLFAYEAANYLLDGISETSQGLAKRTMWRSSIAVITGIGPEMSYRQYTEVLRFFREGGRLAPRSAGRQRHRRTGTRDRRQQGDIRNRRPLRGSPGADEHSSCKSRQLATELSNQYRVTYARPSRLVPPSKTEVSARRPDLRARGMLMKTDK